MEELISKIRNGGNINLIDIRSSYQFDLGHIPGSLNISRDQLVFNTSKYLDKNNIYYIYCQSGSTSRRVANELNYLGYNTINVDGGYNLYLLMN